MTHATPILRTTRLQLRAWRADDLVSFAALNAHPQVMQHLLGPLTRAQSDALAGRMQAHLDAHGFGWWAVEAPGVADFIGAVGISRPRFVAAFTPCVEIGWRLAAAHWGRGYASEAAQAVLDFGFDTVGLDEIVAFTVPDNQRSRAVMRRLGMTHDGAADFDHPLVPEGHRLRRHVLYRLQAPRSASSAT